MKKSRLFSRVVLTGFLLAAAGAPAAVFTNNTAISPFDTRYDGADIAISNCTVIVSGAHSFASLLVGAGGTLTHSFWPNGPIVTTFAVANEPQVLFGTSPATLANTNIVTPLVVTDIAGITTYSNGVDYVQANLPDGTTQIQRTDTSAIPDGATVLVSYSWDDITPAGLTLTLAGPVTVASGGSISADGIGYAAGGGAGSGLSSGGAFFDGSGAGHGGNGGNSSSNAVGGVCYDSLYQPNVLGSGGGASYAGSGGNGGGLVQIVAGGNVRIDGVITANGAGAANSRAGGGAGGSVRISAASVSGLGSITANGGSGAAIHGGGGGGGRIAIQCGTNNFSGRLTAYGGGGSQTGGAGTIFTQLTGQNGMLLVDNGGRTGTNSTVTLPTVADVVISGNAGVTASGQFYSGNLTIATNSTLTAPGLGLSASNMIVQAGGIVSADGLGYPAGSGPGAGHIYFSGGYNYSGGGGHGGYGGAASVTNGAGGSTYDSQTSPATLGSGGGGSSEGSIGGAGGGALQLTVAGNLLVDGRITANGVNGTGVAGGGGSGGSIYLNAGTFAGAGSITVNGGYGADSFGGGGGGGRIAIIAGANSFAGNISSSGGGGANWGGAGTVYLQVAPVGSPGPLLTQLTLDNAGHLGASTPLQSAGSANLIVQNGAVGTANSSVAFASLLVGSNAWLAALTPNSSESFNISGNTTFQAGGGFMADSSGYGSGQGTGAGRYTTYLPYACSGGGHGGTGGSSVSNLVAGGSANDFANSPSSAYPASGGGGTLPYSTGGNGGGFVQMTVNGTLRLDGLITANGGNGSGLGGGGGAGGGVNLSVGTFSGSGAIAANGGSGMDGIGGGGGGGRIAVSFNSNSFTGTVSAYGGGGANYGGGGTIYFRTNSSGRSLLIVDNGGHAGADSSIQGGTSSTTDLTLRNNGLIYALGSASFANLVVGSNALLVVTNQNLNITANNVTVQPGGSINADGGGSSSGQGTGHGNGYFNLPYSCSGGGHGGYGANSLSNSAVGGTAGYDSITSPNYQGSGGGGYLPYSIGGNGGGLIQISVSSSLRVDGTLSANGANGTGTGGGGGSGGSLNLTVGTLSGAGIISANGGNGVDAIGGGGGGGMIAINLNQSNLFAGTITAYGGGGANYGGAGTTYFRTNSTGQTLLIVDNGGHRGTNTLVSSLPNNNLVLRNGAVAVQSSYPLSLTSLLITSNAWMVPGINNPGTVNVSIFGSAAVIQAGGGIVADASGSAQNIGTGRGYISGSAPWYPCSGAGHGGYGAFALSNLIAGGITFDSTTSPSVVGSGGGGTSPFSIGGAGGGYINLAAGKALVQLDGLISANGGNGSGSGGGGGSGGSIIINADSLAGIGTVAANGGNGADAIGGGGGGGRIAIITANFPEFPPHTNIFTGTVSAYGGGGANYGGAGTIYLRTNLQSVALLILDNGNNAGTNTSFDFAINMDVTVQNKAVGLLPATGLWSPRNVLIRSNSVLTTFASGGTRTINANNLTIEAGGAMSLDGTGYGPQTGPGSGAAVSPDRGGAGHGGYGGGNVSGGGAAYDSIQSPTVAGSGGATYVSGPPYSYGGPGGGALTLNVSGTLMVNGRLSANGTNGGFNSGGGAGGSLYLANIYNLAGNGVISANGGSANGAAGGGGGGRIAVVCTSNNFTGQFSAVGGSGNYPGGAGTIYSSVSGVKALAVNNGGINGTNTPLADSFSLPNPPFNLNISGAAAVVPLTPLPLLSNLTVSAGSTLTMPVAQSDLVIAVLNNADLAGNLNVDYLGYAQTNGPGAGGAIGNKGSGGGYGGNGGASSTGAPGGTNYGSATAPVEFGSGGGYGAATVTGGSDGGGALRLSVVGKLNVNGNVSANGNPGAQDDSGGGSGGSVWITAGAFSGAGNISAMGGYGAPLGGGGGGGGRIAIFSPTNNFSGTTNANGGSGATPGQPGTIFLSSALPGFQIISQSPTGLVSNAVSYVDLSFNEAVDPASVSVSNFTLVMPGGTSAVILGAEVSGPSTVRVGFLPQNLLGDYSIQAGTAITNIFGLPLAQAYTGTFTISLPTISGTVTDTNGAPVAGVLLLPDGGLTGVVTDTNGNYALGVPPGWSGSVTPEVYNFMFVPASLTYSNVIGSMANQNYLVVPIAAPNLVPGLNGTNLTMGWTGMSGVTYQTWSSTNLVDWQPLGDPLAGTNGPMQIALPLGTDPAAFFRVSAGP